MGRSQETFGKKEVRTKKEKKRKEKEQKRALRRSEEKSSFDDMIAYVDEFGNITSTPPDPDKKSEIKAENIDISSSRNKQDDTEELLRKGKVTYYDSSKGYGFIRDLESNQSIFVHVNSLLEPITENNTVVFETVKGVKGPAAIKVKIFRE